MFRTARGATSFRCQVSMARRFESRSLPVPTFILRHSCVWGADQIFSSPQDVERPAAHPPQRPLWPHASHTDTLWHPAQGFGPIVRQLMHAAISQSVSAGAAVVRVVVVAIVEHGVGEGVRAEVVVVVPDDDVVVAAAPAGVPVAHASAHMRTERSRPVLRGAGFRSRSLRGMSPVSGRLWSCRLAASARYPSGSRLTDQCPFDDVTSGAWRSRRRSSRDFRRMSGV